MNDFGRLAGAIRKWISNLLFPAPTLPERALKDLGCGIFPEVWRDARDRRRRRREGKTRDKKFCAPEKVRSFFWEVGEGNTESWLPRSVGARFWECGIHFVCIFRLRKAWKGSLKKKRIKWKQFIEKIKKKCIVLTSHVVLIQYNFNFTTITEEKY